jgi:hypothetical protein
LVKITGRNYVSRVNGGKHAIYALSINPFFWVGDIYAQRKEKGRKIAHTLETKPSRKISSEDKNSYLCIDFINSYYFSLAKISPLQ